MKFSKVSPRMMRWMMNSWPPMWFTGINVETISDDFHHVTVTMALRFYNRNVHGIQFGGNIYAMADSWYTLMLMKILGSEYRVIDSEAHVHFIKPGRTRIQADFVVTPEDVKVIKEMTDSGDKYFHEFTVGIKDTDGEVIAQVTKKVYVRMKPKKLATA